MSVRFLPGSPTFQLQNRPHTTILLSTGAPELGLTAVAFDIREQYRSCNLVCCNASVLHPLLRYAVARFNNQKVSETSSVGSFKRPEKELELYEFEGCPFCKKVGVEFNKLTLQSDQLFTYASFTCGSTLVSYFRSARQSPCSTWTCSSVPAPGMAPHGARK